eukprot:Trichotokara_eunicae@DN8086_c0_g1_i2.p1
MSDDDEEYGYYFEAESEGEHDDEERKLKREEEKAQRRREIEKDILAYSNALRVQQRDNATGTMVLVVTDDALEPLNDILSTLKKVLSRGFCSSISFFICRTL